MRILAPAILGVLLAGHWLPAPDAFAQTVPQSRGEIALSFSPVVKQAAPAVVNIYTKKVVERRRMPFADDPFFKDFFGDFFQGRKARRIENSLGSGVIVDPSGVIVSNHHVVGEADEIRVVLQDRREFSATVVLSDEKSDLAIIQLDRAEDLPFLELRDSDTLEVGDLVLAIGNPFGVGQTVTSGIVSALARPGGRRARGAGYFIQTDAAINPGNSGGALVDLNGRLVGVNTAILSRSGGSNGIGFAVPANLVARVIESANQGMTMLERPWLGLSGQEVTGEIAEAIALDMPRGVLVDQLHPASAFAAAGVKTGDILLTLDEDPVNSVSELSFRSATIGTGRSVPLTFLRSGGEQTASVSLFRAPEDPPRNETELDGAFTGIAVANINPAVIEEQELSLNAEGVLITRVQGRARRLGLQPGDILIAVNGTGVRNSGIVPELLMGESFEFEIQRGSKRGKIRLGD
ncbi:MAG: Do family serine endopeptidase [Pseudomonadota bacterium]